MSEQVREYFRRFAAFIDGVQVTDGQGARLDTFQGIEEAAELALAQAEAGGKIFFIGNGGSAAIASHMATDYCKNGGIRAMAFNDSSLLTCLSNDYGYRHVFEKPIEMFGEEGDLLFAISSSGRSENILRGVEAARKLDIGVVTLSGFDAGNELRTRGDLNLWVPSHQYGPVEVIHHALCHAILDTLMRIKGARPACE